LIERIEEIAKAENKSFSFIGNRMLMDYLNIENNLLRGQTWDFCLTMRERIQHYNQLKSQGHEARKAQIYPDLVLKNKEETDQ